MFDIFTPETITVSVLGIPLLFVVIGIVTVMRKAGLDGRALLFSSLGWGTLVGSLYQCAANGTPADFAGWFGVIFYGLAIGIMAALFYDTLKGMLDRGLTGLIDKLEDIFLGRLADLGQKGQ